MNNGKVTSVLIVDDHSLMREGIKALLATSDDMRVVGEASNGQEAIDKARQLTPHVILMDLSLPLINGTEAMRHIKQRSGQTKIIAVTAHKSADHIHASLDSGADGYVLKNDTSDDLISAIRNVVSGKTFLSSGICDKVVLRFREQSSDNGSGRSGYWNQLTPRERQIIKMIAEGQKNREIAENLSISIKTVEKHRSNLMKKLDLHSISALTTFAIDQNIICP